MGGLRWKALLVGCGLTVLTMADEAIQPLETISHQVREFLVTQHRLRAEPPQIELTNLDSRLRLAKCGAALEAFCRAARKRWVIPPLECVVLVHSHGRSISEPPSGFSSKCWWLAVFCAGELSSAPLICAANGVTCRDCRAATKRFPRR